MSEKENTYIKFIYPDRVIKKTFAAYLFQVSNSICEILKIPYDSLFWFPVRLSSKNEKDFELKVKINGHINVFTSSMEQPYERIFDYQIPVMDFINAVKKSTSDEEWVREFRVKHMGKEIADLF
jgi:hypothetical protein